MPVTKASMIVQAASGPNRRLAKAATLSWSGTSCGLGRHGSFIIASLPLQLRALVVSNPRGDPGSLTSLPFKHKYRFFREDSLAAISCESIPSSRQRCSVLGFVSRKPFGPASQVKPFSVNVRMLPPARGAASRTTTSTSGMARRSRYAAASPLIPPPMTTTRDMAFSNDFQHSKRDRCYQSEAERNRQALDDVERLRIRQRRAH